MLKKYKLGFDIWGLILFLIIMIPNFIWFIIPAPNDVLRNTSVTPHLDTIASVLQVIIVAVLCIIKNETASRIGISKWIIISSLCCLYYYVNWGFYYCGITNAGVILGLTIPPCLAFLFYAIDRKNHIAIFPIIAFLICHLLYAVVNYIA